MSKWYRESNKTTELCDALDELIDESSISEVLGAFLLVLRDVTSDLGCIDSNGKACEQLLAKLTSVLDYDDDFPEEE